MFVTLQELRDKAPRPCVRTFVIAASPVDQRHAVQPCSVHDNAEDKAAFQSTIFNVHFADTANTPLPSDKRGGSLVSSIVKRVIVQAAT